MRAIGVAVILWLLLAALPRDAAAQGVFEDGDVLINGYTEELGGIAYAGTGEFSLPEMGLTPNVQGLYWRDRDGLVTRATAGLVIAVSSALAQSGPKSVETRTTVTSDYIITETRTTYYSEEEKAAMRASANNAIDGVFSTRNADFELQVFSRDRFGRGDASGYKMNFYLGTGGKSWAFESGFGIGNVDSNVVKDGVNSVVGYEYIGMPFRLQYAFSKVRTMLQVDWNWMAYSDDPATKMTSDGRMEYLVRRHPLTAAAQVALFGRVSLMGGLTMPNVGKVSKPGYWVSAGLRF